MKGTPEQVKRWREEENRARKRRRDATRNAANRQAAAAYLHRAQAARWCMRREGFALDDKLLLLSYVVWPDRLAEVEAEHTLAETG